GAQAHRAGARAAEGPADPAAGRGDVGARSPVRAPGPGSALEPDGGPHDARHRTSAGDRARRRLHRGARRRRGQGDGHARRAAAPPRQSLQTALRSAVPARGSRAVIRSMTGYGAAAAESTALKAAVTVRSLNHRYLDLTVHLSRRLQALEPEIKRVVQERISRGRVELAVQATMLRGGEDAQVAPSPLVAGLVRALRQIQA